MLISDGKDNNIIGIFLQINRIWNNYKDKIKASYCAMYDNSILFTDHILNEIIKMLKKDEGANCVLYLSDHGQDIYDNEECNPTSHDTINAYEIPFIVWISEKYKLLSQEFIKNLNPDKAYLTDRTAFSLIDLTRLKHDEIDLSESIFFNNNMP